MLIDISHIEHLSIICGATDFREGIEGVSRWFTDRWSGSILRIDLPIL